MLQDTAAIEARYTRFIQQVIEKGQVWGLLADEGWATSDSNDYEDVEVIVFWSDKAECKAAATEEWSHYEPDSIPLGEFLESWCVGLHNNNTLAGVNWDANLFGMEAEPLQLASDLVDALLKKKKDLKLHEFDSLQDFKQQVDHVLNAEPEEEGEVQ